MLSESCRRQLAGFGMTTAHILYRRPDHPWLLQSYVWQEYDTWPDLPVLLGFLAFWRKSLDGALHSVVVAHSALNRPADRNALGVLCIVACGGLTSSAVPTTKTLSVIFQSLRFKLKWQWKTLPW